MVARRQPLQNVLCFSIVWGIVFFNVVIRNHCIVFFVVDDVCTLSGVLCLQHWCSGTFVWDISRACAF